MEQYWDLATAERYWDFVAILATMAALVNNGYMTYRLVRPYVVRRWSAAAAGITYVAVMISLYFVPWEMGGMFAYALGTTVAFAVLYASDRGKLKQKLFLGLTMYLLEWIAHGITVQVRSLLFWGVLNTPYMVSDRSGGFAPILRWKFSVWQCVACLRAY